MNNTRHVVILCASVRAVEFLWWYLSRTLEFRLHVRRIFSRSSDGDGWCSLPCLFSTGGVAKGDPNEKYQDSKGDSNANASFCTGAEALDGREALFGNRNG